MDVKNKKLDAIAHYHNVPIVMFAALHINKVFFYFVDMSMPEEPGSTNAYSDKT